MKQLKLVTASLILSLGTISSCANEHTAPSSLGAESNNPIAYQGLTKDQQKQVKDCQDEKNQILANPYGEDDPSYNPNLMIKAQEISINAVTSSLRLKYVLPGSQKYCRSKLGLEGQSGMTMSLADLYLLEQCVTEHKLKTQIEDETFAKEQEREVTIRELKARASENISLTAFHFLCRIESYFDVKYPADIETLMVRDYFFPEQRID